MEETLIFAMLVHAVYFWLKPDLSDAQRADFRREVDKLAAIATVEKIYIGGPAGTTPRPVIDHSFTVALILLFRDVAAHDAYQVDPLHQAFVERNRTLWTRVQIFDSA